MCLAIVCVTLRLVFNCCELIHSLRAVLYWVVGAQANCATSQAPAMACKADAIQCGIDLAPVKILWRQKAVSYCIHPRSSNSWDSSSVSNWNGKCAQHCTKAPVYEKALT